MKLIYEKSVPGRRGFRLPDNDVPTEAAIPDSLRRGAPPAMPEVSELQVIRHFTQLSHKNMSVDSHFYPLGSCTMKYNPRFAEEIARLPGFARLHPLLPQLRQGGTLTQGALRVLFETGRLLSKLTAMHQFTMQPLAGSHGELTGAMIIAAYHKYRSNKKRKILIPDSAHGTNPASAAIAGYDVVAIPTGDRGVLDAKTVKEYVDDEVAALMLTCPNTLGLFNSEIAEIAQMVHEVDGLMYYDGANLNAIMGRARPGDFGFDIVHLNLHKSFGTPHGGGGPGAGPVGVTRRLARFLPTSVVERRRDGTYYLNYARKDSIGYIAPFYGNFGVILKAYAYLLALGGDGLKRVADEAVLNANYLRARLKKHYDIPYDRHCMHEFVLSAARQAKQGVKALDIAKALIDRGFHPPTMYFPTVVPEALMIEPTETESKETLDEFADAMIRIAEEAREQPEALRASPSHGPVGRLDEVAAARNLDVCFENPASDPAR